MAADQSLSPYGNSRALLAVWFDPGCPRQIYMITGILYYMYFIIATYRMSIARRAAQQVTHKS